jgi:peptidyl-prolyl cis-trans isomerase D
VVRQAFRLEASKLPAYAGVENPQLPYTLVRVTRVQVADLSPEKARELASALRRIQAQEAMAAYLAALRQTAGVTINKELLERKER